MVAVAHRHLTRPLRSAVGSAAADPLPSPPLSRPAGRRSAAPPLPAGAASVCSELLSRAYLCVE